MSIKQLFITFTVTAAILLFASSPSYAGSCTVDYYFGADLEENNCESFVLHNGQPISGSGHVSTQFDELKCKLFTQKIGRRLIAEHCPE